jgi:hypothetical protein
MTSSPHGPYGLGYTRATMAVTVGSEPRGELISKSRLSSDCSLQLESMKLESLVIADQHAAVNTFPGLVHTARHTMGVGLPEGGALTARRQLTTVGSATGVKS